MKCPKCGKEVANDNLFCEYCGAQTKRGNKQVDIRWALLPAMLFATIEIMLFWGRNEYDQDEMNLFANCILLLAVIFLIVAIWVVIKKKVANSFCLLMFTFFLLNGALVFDTLDSVYAIKRIYVIHSSNVEIGETSLEIKTRYTWRLINKVDLMWKHMIPELENDGIDDIIEYSYETNYMHNECHDIGLVACAIATCLFIFYFLYAFIAYKKGWTF